MFKFFKDKRKRKKTAQTMYEGVVRSARQPVFYEDMAVPDTVDGRFEMISLHCYILVHRLSQSDEPDKKKLSQALFDSFFVNMERSLREMGIGDLAVPKHMKRMMQGFNGRARHYEDAIMDKDKLKEALARNVFGTITRPDDAILNQLADYVQKSANLPINDMGFAPITIPNKKVGKHA